MGLVNQLLQLYEECRAANRDVYLSFKLRDGVESFSFKNILRPSSPPPSSGGSGRRRRRQRGPRRRNRQRWRVTFQVKPPKRSLGGVERNPGQGSQGDLLLFSLLVQEKPRPKGGPAVRQRPLGFVPLLSPECGRDNPSTMKYGCNAPVSPIVPTKPPSPKTPAFTPPCSRHVAWTKHQLPSPTPSTWRRSYWPRLFNLISCTVGRKDSTWPLIVAKWVVLFTFTIFCLKKNKKETIFLFITASAPT